MLEVARLVDPAAAGPGRRGRMVHRFRSVPEALVEKRLEVGGRNQPDSQGGNRIDVATAYPRAERGCGNSCELGNLSQPICEAATRVGIQISWLRCLGHGKTITRGDKTRNPLEMRYLRISPDNQATTAIARNLLKSGTFRTMVEIRATTGRHARNLWG